MSKISKADNNIDILVVIVSTLFFFLRVKVIFKPYHREGGREKIKLVRDVEILL